MFGLIQRHTTVEIKIVDSLTTDTLIFDTDAVNSEPIAHSFYLKYDEPNSALPHTTYFAQEPVILTDDGTNDLVATIFYMINCLQERSCPESQIDKFGRYKYTASYQYRFECVEENLVLQYIKQLLQRWDWPLSTPRNSSIFLSHDIDALDGSWMHIVYYLLKQKRIITAFKAFAKGLMQKPFFRTIPELLALHQQYGIISTFFFIPIQGRGRFRIQNADYNINDESNVINSILSDGHSLGLHKSSKALPLVDELKKLPFATKYNRFHFLSHQPHTDWAKIEQANIAVDASLGFAEHIGFRNSYGLPFHPYNPETEEEFSFLEVPLFIMDGMLWSSMQLSSGEIGERMIEFIERNKTDCLISILWHNTSMTEYPYPGLLASYRELLEYFDSRGFEYTELDGVLEDFSGKFK